MTGMREWAQLGAARRVEEISQELAAIARSVPDLKAGDGRRRVMEGAEPVKFDGWAS